MLSKKKNYKWILPILTLLIALFCLSQGSVNISFKEYLKTHTISEKEINILLNIRLPRVLLAALVGVSLSLSGASMQAVLSNPLADGGTLGVSQAAALGAVIGYYLNSKSQFVNISLSIALALVLSFLALVLIILLTYRLDRNLSTRTLILVGLLMSMLFGSLTNLVIVWLKKDTSSVVYWSFGSFSAASFTKVVLVLVSVIIFGGVLFYYSKELDILTLGEESARNLGVNVRRIRLLTLIASSLLIAVAVSVSGSIGFVGLLIPYICRLIFGAGYKKLLYCSVFIGASFLMLVDLLARTIIKPVELPIGFITSLIGAAFLAGVLFKKKE